MRLVFPLAVLSVALGCAMASCQSSVAEEDLAPTIADELCNLQQECDCQGQSTVDECRVIVEQAYRAFLVPPPSANLTYDAECAGEIVDAYGDIGCDTIEALISSEPECRVCKVYHGSKEAGAACERFEDTAFDDCGPGLYCSNEICRDPCETVGQGEECSGRQCSEGLVCTFAFDSEESTCQIAGSLGDSCEDAFCADELICDSETFTCAAAPGAGESCTGTGTCDESSWCDTTDPDFENWLCKAPKGDGEACMSDSECSSDNCDNDTDSCMEQRPLVCQIQPD